MASCCRCAGVGFAKQCDVRVVVVVVVVVVVAVVAAKLCSAVACRVGGAC
jgi:hypothetical protein